ncbi:MAG TPA: amidohydrolase family protein [Chloroflexota bacterium]|nr:amidohydrolase family protein [Chloroflexota bacterium]
MLLIEGGLAITMDSQRRIVRADLAIDGERILELGKDLRTKYPQAERIDAAECVVTPGLIDAHVHLSEHIIRGLVPDDAPDTDWLPKWLLPAYTALTEEEEQAAITLACIEMIRTGTTTFCEAGTVMHPAAAIETLREMGLRGVLATWTWDRPPEPLSLRRTAEQALRQLDDLLALDYPAWPIILGMGTASDELIAGAHAVAAKHGRGFGMMHRGSLREPPLPLAHLAELGVLDRRTKLAHEVYVEDGELELLAGSGASVVHVPTAALHHPKGIHRYGKFPEMLDLGIPVALGADSSNGSNHLDMTRLMWLVAHLYKDFRMDVRMVPAETALEMATFHGARALLLEEEIGSIEPGKRADLVLWNLNTPEWRPLLNPVNNLVHAAAGNSVDTVVVGGRVLLQKGQFVALDERRAYARVDELASGLLARIGLSAPNRWPITW